jgi:opacity protein-like surface antigen
MIRSTGSMQAIFLAGALAAGMVSTGANAADLALPPPPPMEAPPPPPPQFGGWYLRGDVGVGINQLSSLRSSFDSGFDVPGDRFDQAAVSDSAIIDLGIGYQFNNWFHADVTGEYRTGARYSAIESYTPPTCPFGRCYDNYSANVSSAVFLANGYFDIGTWYGVTPYVGAGVGFANNWVNGLTDTGTTVGGFGFAPTSSNLNFAWAAMAGLSYAVTPNLRLELGYRYLDRGDITTAGISCTNAPACGHEVQRFHLASQDIRLGMRWMFADIPPVAPQLPLVSKY